MSDVLRAFLLVAGALLATARNDTSARVMLDGGRYVPMWRGRLDPIYGLSYFTPSLIVNKCSPKYVSSTKLGQSLARLLACLLAGWLTHHQPTHPLTHPPNTPTPHSFASRQSCSLIAGETYPYSKVVTDPSSGNPNQPVLRVKYPAGSWSPGSAKPGGVLDYAFPTKTEPFEKSFPVSTEVCGESKLARSHSLILTTPALALSTGSHSRVRGLLSLQL